MDEIWERAVETALEGITDHALARTLTLDGAVKCFQGRLPPPSLLEKFENLQHLSIANVGVSSLEQFPRLRNLQKLNLSDNRIAGGLESLVRSGLEALRDLDLSNNRIQFIEDLAPLAQLKLVSLDLYECPVTRVKEYRSRVFGLIKSLKYLDKMDAEENERPESDDEEEDEDDDEEEEEDDDDPGSGEVDGEERLNGRIMSNGHSEGVVDVDDDDESDADVEEVEAGPRVTQGGPGQNGFDEDEGDDDDDDDEEDYIESGEEIDEEDGDEDDVVEVHEVEDDSSDEDGDEDDDEEDDGEDEEEEIDNVEGDKTELASNGRIPSIEGEIDGHEQGEDDADDDDNGETGEEEQVVEDDGEFEDEDEDEDSDAGYLVQRVGQSEVHNADGSDMEQGGEEDEPEVDEEVKDDEVQVLPSSQLKRKRDDKKGDENGDAVDKDDDDDPDCSDSPAKKKHQ